ncbi:uncharacterized protein [Panulirus ornatus]|uniref:uncharacterized protein isoform X2 n=1 Tax=Panulirus ornatus TaxID=150431 RepID=UPI003A8BB47C
MTTKAEEVVAGCTGTPPTPAPRLYPPPSTPADFPRPSSSGGGGGGGGVGFLQEARAVRVVGKAGAKEEEAAGGGAGGYPAQTIRQLAKVNLVVASVIFLCLLVMAVCLCRPVVIMGGLWVGILVLVQAILGLRVADSAISHALTVGYAWLSGGVCVMGLATAGYLFSGHLTLACVSAFHRPDHASVVRLYVVEVVSLVASLPCLVSTIVSLLAAALSARAACPPKQKTEAPFVLYLPRWGESVYGSDRHTVVQSQARTSPVTSSTTAQPSSNESGERANSPPPSYNQIAEESFA